MPTVNDIVFESGTFDLFEVLEWGKNGDVDGTCKPTLENLVLDLLCILLPRANEVVGK